MPDSPPILRPLVPQVRSTPESLLRLHREIRDYAVVLYAAGEIDLATAHQLERQLLTAEALVTAPAPVVCDLTAVRFISSTGLALLVRHHDRCVAQNTPLRVVADQRAMLHLLEVTCLDRVLDIHRSLPSALAPTGELARFGVNAR